MKIKLLEDYKALLGRLHSNNEFYITGDNYIFCDQCVERDVLRHTRNMRDGAHHAIIGVIDENEYDLQVPELGPEHGYICNDCGKEKEI